MDDHLSLNEFQNAPVDEPLDVDGLGNVGEVYFLRVNSVNEISGGDAMIASTTDAYIEENQIPRPRCNML